MIYFNAVFGACLIVGFYYWTITVLDAKGFLECKKNGKMIVSKSVLLVGLVSFVSECILGVIRFSNMEIPAMIATHILIGSLSILAVIDYKKNIVPNKMLLIMLAAWVSIAGIYTILQTEKGLGYFFSALIGGIIGGSIFLLCYILSKRQLGAGDVKLVFIMGLYLTGHRIVGAIFYGVTLCCIYSVVQLLRKKIGLKDGVPLVPFLYMGTLITFFIL